ncbi:hypothetical protein EDB89DRAFT_322961 [Lactarius sanguifluus]|nr:hypothetical protein EDB89DRAFT_322961 [Lactarius sanguifluus]
MSSTLGSPTLSLTASQAATASPTTATVSAKTVAWQTALGLVVVFGSRYAFSPRPLIFPLTNLPTNSHRCHRRSHHCSPRARRVDHINVLALERKDGFEEPQLRFDDLRPSKQLSLHARQNDATLLLRDGPSPSPEPQDGDHVLDRRPVASAAGPRAPDVHGASVPGTRACTPAPCGASRPQLIPRPVKPLFRLLPLQSAQPRALAFFFFWFEHALAFAFVSRSIFSFIHAFQIPYTTYCYDAFPLTQALGCLYWRAFDCLGLSYRS